MPANAGTALYCARTLTRLYVHFLWELRIKLFFSRLFKHVVNTAGITASLVANGDDNAGFALVRFFVGATPD